MNAWRSERLTEPMSKWLCTVQQRVWLSWSQGQKESIATNFTLVCYCCSSKTEILLMAVASTIWNFVGWKKYFWIINVLLTLTFQAHRSHYHSNNNNKWNIFITSTFFEFMRSNNYLFGWKDKLWEKLLLP